MKQPLIILFLLILVIVPYAAASTLNFLPKPSQDIYNSYKGGSVNIYYNINNYEAATLTCVITSNNQYISQRSLSISIIPNSVGTANFLFNAPNKINGLASPMSVDFTATCSGNIQTSSVGCGGVGALWLSPCYSLVSYSQSQGTQVQLSLSPQDQQNLAILQNYKTAVENEITNSDSQLKTINTLIGKTPPLLLPTGSTDLYNNQKNTFDEINSKFSKVKDYLEQEVYDYASNYLPSSNDVQNLKNIDSTISGLSSQINSNIKDYNDLVESFNQEVTKNNNLIRDYTTKANSDLVDKYNSITSSLKSNFQTYSFSSLDGAKSSLDEYKTKITEIIGELQNRESKTLNSGKSTLSGEITSLCKNYSFCSDRDWSITGNLISSDSSNVKELCNSYKNIEDGVNKTNQKTYINIDNSLKGLSYNNTNSLSLDEKVSLFNSINDNLSSISLNDEKEIQNSVKEANNIGKKLDLSSYSELVKEYNSGDLVKKQQLILNISDEKSNIVNKTTEIVSNENGFFVIFKRLYYSFFGEKQKIEEINIGNSSKVINISQNFLNFYSDNCNNYLNLQNNTASYQKINVQTQQSDISTNVATPQATCIDENGQTTTNCCNSDDYKNKEDLYPVIFVHGHAMETGGNSIQQELDTFNYISNYFKQSGYVEKDFQYPETTSQLSKGVWAYCKPVAIRVTYYQGIVNGATAQSNYQASIADYAPVLKKEIDNILTATNKNKAVIVTHSMGGIIARYYIKNNGGANSVDKLIEISAPNYGTTIAVSGISSTSWGAIESKQMKPGSDFLNVLNDKSDSLVDSYTIEGWIANYATLIPPNVCQDCDGVVPTENAKLKDNNNQNFVFNGGSYGDDTNEYSHGEIVNQLKVAQKVLSIIKGN